MQLAPARRLPQRRRSGGYALFAVLGAMLVLSVLLFSLLSVAGSSRLMSVRREEAQQAFELAEGGLRHGARRLARNEEYLGEKGTSFGPGRFDVSVTSIGSDPDLRLVSSTARIGGSGGREMRRTVTAVMDMRPASRIWGQAIITQRTLDLSGNPETNSEPIRDQGHIHSNQDLSLSGSAYVGGRASAVGSVITGGSPRITGGTENGAEPIDFPTLDTTAMKAKAAALGTYQGDLRINGQSTVVLKGVINGDLRVSGGARVIIDGWVWVTGEVHLSGNGVAGTGAFIAEKQINVSGNPSVISSTLTPRSLVLVSLWGPSSQVAVDITGNPSIDGSVFAPNGTVSIRGNADIHGTVAAVAADVRGNPTVVRNTGFESPLIEINPPRIVYWYGG